MRRTIACLLAAALPAAAPVFGAPLSDTLFDTEVARAALAEELRAVLTANPEILERALRPTAPSGADIYRDARDTDLARIAAAAPHLFGPGWPLIGAQPGAPDGTGRDTVALALFTGADCAECARAETELAALLAERGETARVIDADSARGRALMERLTLDALPSYVLPEMMVRGHVPAFVLTRYLDR
ncbi:hypothetical protein SAMN05421759_103186 [Roseivivax lentus]|uniref:Uncharacterized protein n=1 Tax=Roseivivax lentus TaxID=633194 RepID=A0A1N7LV45_9RHOB|nr:hypothetical protein [Roseivivax lentus]SIS77713.1 hypothetical protein SAMN05421759_103186 [Roseivivax lentus]